MGLGSSTNGQLGSTPPSAYNATPQLIARNVTDFATGDYHVVWINTDGELWGSGRARSGQLGDPVVDNVTTPRLLARQVMAGFVVSGTEPLTALIRAVGPGLNQFGVDGTLANPTLQIFNAAGDLVVANDDWAAGDPTQTAELETVSAQLGAFGLTPGSADAALLVTLSPGAYTAQIVRGEAPGGVVLLEVYNRNPRSWRSRLARGQIR